MGIDARGSDRFDMVVRSADRHERPDHAPRGIELFETGALIGADEFAVMTPGAWLLDMERNDMADQDALIAAFEAATERQR